MKKAAVFLVIFLTCFQAFSFDGTYMETKWKAYQNQSDSLDAMFFVGYVSAVIDYNQDMIILTDQMNSPQLVFDLPKGISLTQLCNVAGRFLEAHPEMWSYEAFSIIWQAFDEPWGRK